MMPPIERRTNCDGMYRAVRERCPNACVSWYLTSSFAYYHCDAPFISDALYDEICRDIDARWDEIVHPQQHLMQRDQLRAGTGYYLTVEALPLSVRAAARVMMRDLDLPPPPAWMMQLVPLPPAMVPEPEPEVIAPSPPALQAAALPILPLPPPAPRPVQLALF